MQNYYASILNKILLFFLNAGGFLNYSFDMVAIVSKCF